MFKIKFESVMKKQLPELDKEFETKEQAYMYGISRYGSALFQSKHGWRII